MTVEYARSPCITRSIHMIKDKPFTTIHINHCSIQRFTVKYIPRIDKNVVIPPHTKIGFDREEDLKRGFHVSAGGVTVVPKGAIL